MEIKQILVDAWSILVERKDKLIKVLPLPVVLLAVLGIGHNYQQSVLISFMLLIANILLTSMIAVATHRVILIGSDSIPDAVPKPDKRVLVFIAYSIGLGLILVPIALISVFIPMGLLLYFLCMAYIVGRLSLVFPAIAIDAPWRFSDSWNATKEHQTAMFVVVGLLPALFIILDSIFLGFTFFGVIWSFLSAMIIVYFVAVLSVSFQRLCDRI